MAKESKYGNVEEFAVNYIIVNLLDGVVLLQRTEINWFEKKFTITENNT